MKRSHLQPSIPIIAVGVILLHLVALWGMQAGAFLPAKASNLVSNKFIVKITSIVPVSQYGIEDIAIKSIATDIKQTISQTSRSTEPTVEKTSPLLKPLKHAAEQVGLTASTTTKTPITSTTATALVATAHATPTGPNETVLGTTSEADISKLSAPPADTASGVELPSSDADYLNNPSPSYPALSRRLNEQGRVVVRVLIDNQGHALKAEIKTSSGFDRLDQAALDTALIWRYVPGKRAGIAQSMWLNVPIQFALK